MNICKAYCWIQNEDMIIWRMANNFSTKNKRATNDKKKSRIRDTLNLSMGVDSRPIPKIWRKYIWSWVMCHLSPVTSHLSPLRCHMSPGTWHLSSATCHLTTTLCSFSFYESPRRFGDAAAGGLVIDRVKNTFVLPKTKQKSVCIWAI